MRLALIIVSILALIPAGVQTDWKSVEDETMRHFQTILRFDTSDPPGHEAPAVEYLKTVLEREGIPVKVLALDPKRPNLVARLLRHRPETPGCRSWDIPTSSMSIPPNGFIRHSPQLGPAGMSMVVAPLMTKTMSWRV